MYHRQLYKNPMTFINRTSKHYLHSTTYTINCGRKHSIKSVGAYLNRQLSTIGAGLGLTVIIFIGRGCHYTA